MVVFRSNAELNQVSFSGSSAAVEFFTCRLVLPRLSKPITLYCGRGASSVSERIYRLLRFWIRRFNAVVSFLVARNKKSV